MCLCQKNKHVWLAPLKIIKQYTEKLAWLHVAPSLVKNWKTWKGCHHIELIFAHETIKVSWSWDNYLESYKGSKFFSKALKSLMDKPHWTIKHISFPVSDTCEIMLWWISTRSSFNWPSFFIHFPSIPYEWLVFEKKWGKSDATHEKNHLQITIKFQSFTRDGTQMVKWSHSLTFSGQITIKAQSFTIIFALRGVADRWELRVTALGWWIRVRDLVINRPLLEPTHHYW